MSGELADVQERLPRYRAATANQADVGAAFARAEDAIVKAFRGANLDADAETRASLDELQADIHAALVAQELVDAYLGALPCVETFVSTELDAATPGERGLGRSSTSPPRLAGAFRGQLSEPAVQQEFGALIEAMLLETYAGTAAGLQSVMDSPERPRFRTAQELFPLWVPRMYVGTKGLPDPVMSMITAAHADTEARILEAGGRHGLVSGLRKRSKTQTLVECASFWCAAGAALYWVPIQR